MEVHPILFVNLGSPESPSVKHVREYLSVFFNGPCMGEGCAPWLWELILRGYILPFRPKKLRYEYEKIWDGKKFLSETIFENFLMAPGQYPVAGANIFKRNDITRAFKELAAFNKKIIVVPCFPQFSEAVNGRILSEVNQVADDLGLSLVTVKSFHLYESFLSHTVTACEKVAVDHLVFSFHSYPCSRSKKGDPYERHCIETFEALRDRMIALPKERINLAFHSRFMFGSWLGPDIDEVLKKLIGQGAKNIAIHSPSFIFDNLETAGELGRRITGKFGDMGARIHFIPCLNADHRWVQDFQKEILERITQQ